MRKRGILVQQVFDSDDDNVADTSCQTDVATSDGADPTSGLDNTAESSMYQVPQNDNLFDTMVLPFDERFVPVPASSESDSDSEGEAGSVHTELVPNTTVQHINSFNSPIRWFKIVCVC